MKQRRMSSCFLPQSTLQLRMSSSEERRRTETEEKVRKTGRGELESSVVIC